MISQAITVDTDKGSCYTLRMSAVGISVIVEKEKTVINTPNLVLYSEHVWTGRYRYIALIMTVVWVAN